MVVAKWELGGGLVMVEGGLVVAWYLSKGACRGLVVAKGGLVVAKGRLVVAKGGLVVAW